MTQRIGSASGIVAVLVVLGIILYMTGVAKGIGEVAIVAGVGIGILYGLLGGVGIVKRLF